MNRILLIFMVAVLAIIYFLQNYNIFLVPESYRRSESHFTGMSFVNTPIYSEPSPIKISKKLKDETDRKCHVTKWFGPKGYPEMGEGYCKVECIDKIYYFCFPSVDYDTGSSYMGNEILNISNPYSNHILCEYGSYPDNVLIENKSNVVKQRR